MCALLDNEVQCSCLTIHFSSKLWQYFMDYLDELCSCSWQVSLDWRWSGKSSCLRWLSTTPQPGEWTGTEEQATSALGTGHLKNTHTHQQITGWNRWACCRRYKHTWDRGSLSDLSCQWKQLKVLKLTFLSQPPPKSWPRWSIYVSYMNHAWLLLEFHGYWDWPQNSITPTEMTTALPAGQIRYPAPIP